LEEGRELGVRCSAAALCSAAMLRCCPEPHTKSQVGSLGVVVTTKPQAGQVPIVHQRGSLAVQFFALPTNNRETGYASLRATACCSEQSGMTWRSGFSSGAASVAAWEVRVGDAWDVDDSEMLVTTI
jgi:hypothetical protein